MKKSLLIVLLFISHIAFAQESKPFVLGEILELDSKQLSEKRVLNIYLPEGYNPKDTISYPVIYLLDGSADEDFIHVAGLVQYCNFSWVDILPKSILVGIANVDRRRDFTYPTTIEKDKVDFPTTGKSEKFLDFIEKELQPFVEKKYRTNTSKTIVGQSLGGLLATEVLFKRPYLFSKYIIVSPSLWWDNESLLNADKLFLKDSFKQGFSVYLAVGNEGKVMIDAAKRLHEILLGAKKTKVNATYRHFDMENHATIFHLAVYDAFESFSKKK